MSSHVLYYFTVNSEVYVHSYCYVFLLFKTLHKPILPKNSYYTHMYTVLINQEVCRKLKVNFFNTDQNNRVQVTGNINYKNTDKILTESIRKTH